MRNFKITKSEHSDMIKQQTNNFGFKPDYVPVFEENNNYTRINDLEKFEYSNFETESSFKKRPSYFDIIKNFKQDEAGNIDMEQFSEDSLRTKYEQLKYRVSSAKNYVLVSEGNTRILTVKKNSDGSIVYINDKTNEEYNIDKNGVLTTYKNLNEDYNAIFINKKLYKESIPEDSLNYTVSRLATVMSNSYIANVGVTKSSIKNLIMKTITKDNVEEIAYEYRKKTGHDLITDLKTRMNKKIFDKSTLEEFSTHITKCFYNPDYKKSDSQVKRPEMNYEGDVYDITQSNNIILVKNTRTQLEREIDLNKLCKDISPTDKAKFIRCLQQLPGEVLEDLAIEADYINIYNIINNRSFYNPDDDEINLNSGNFNVESILHELGHAIDFMHIMGKNRPTSDTFEKIFTDELRQLEAAGILRHKETFNTQTRRYTKLQGSKGTYATWNTKEMFAECYSLLMSGNCSSKDIITEYFPQTLNAVKETLRTIREQKPTQRHIS